MEGGATPEGSGQRARGFRRLSGLDRSGPGPAQTRRGQPLRPWTLPNLVGYLRIAAIPVFLSIALCSADGRVPAATLLYFLITAGDYLDGFLARATGQYSRLGALMDPAIDRAAALAGAVVCWRFELLPRWGLALLAARELVTLLLARMALRRGLEIEISWVGRLGTFGVFAGLFWSLVIDSWVTAALFLAGLALEIYATALYAISGRRALASSRIPAKGSSST